MNTYCPAINKQIIHHLNEAVRLMKIIDCDEDTIEDLEQTTHIIETEFNDATAAMIKNSKEMET